MDDDNLDDSRSRAPDAEEATVTAEEATATRRDRRGTARGGRGGVWRKGAAIAIALGLAVGTYGFVSASTGQEHVAALGSQDPSPGETPASEAARSGPVSRSVDRFPLEGSTERTVVVVVDGEERELTTREETLAGALAEAGVEVGFLDEVSAPMGGVPVDATIETVTESIEVVEEEIPHKTTRKETSSLTKGTEKVHTKGQPGQRKTTKRVRTKGDEVIGEEILAEAVGSDPVTEVVLVGTKPKPAPKPDPAPAPVTASGGSGGGDSSSGGGSSGGGGSSAPAPSSHSGQSPRGIAQGMLSSFGWGQDQWSCLNNLWIRESQWNPRASNPYSGAYGIPQALPGSKMASAGGDWRTNPATQIKWGLGYIKGRYGSPCAAWGHSNAHNWY